MTMQNNTPQANKPTTTPVKKDWTAMTKEERHAFSIAKKAEAITKVQAGDFPSAISVKLGEHTLYAKPSGVSEKGSVSYSINPMILTLKGKQVRINKLNISVLSNHMEGLEELPMDEGSIL